MAKLKLAVAAAIAAAFTFSAGAQTPPRSLKTQSTWPASITLQDHFRQAANYYWPQ